MSRNGKSLGSGSAFKLPPEPRGDTHYLHLDEGGRSAFQESAEDKLCWYIGGGIQSVGSEVKSERARGVLGKPSVSASALCGLAGVLVMSWLARETSYSGELRVLCTNTIESRSLLGHPPRRRYSRCALPALSEMAQTLLDIFYSLSNCLFCFPGSPQLKINNRSFRMLRLLGEVWL